MKVKGNPCVLTEAIQGNSYVSLIHVSVFAKQKTGSDTCIKTTSWN